MKRFMILLIVLLAVWGLTAQEATTEAEKAQQELQESEQELQEAYDETQAEMEEVKEQMRIISSTSADGVNVTVEYDTSQKAFMGIFASNLSLTKARDLNYTGDYGIIINRISENTAADKYRLMANDILMKIDDNKLYDYKTFTNVLSQYSPGDEAVLTLFRAGEEITQDFEFGQRGKSVETAYFTVDDYMEDADRTGHGGIGWTPQLYHPDLDDINYIMNKFGFSDLDDKGLFMHGIHGNFHVGKNFYLGGSYYWYPELSRSRNYVTADSVNTTRKLRYYTKYWGISLDRRFRIASWMTTSVGFTAGKSTTSIKVAQTASDAGNVTWGDIETGMDMSGNNQLELKKEYIIFHPRVATYIKILDWLRIRAEAGYMFGYSWHSGWQAKMMDKSFDMADSPNTSYDGWTFSIGPWLGF